MFFIDLLHRVLTLILPLVSFLILLFLLSPSPSSLLHAHMPAADAFILTPSSSSSRTRHGGLSIPPFHAASPPPATCPATATSTSPTINSFKHTTRARRHPLFAAAAAASDGGDSSSSSGKAKFTSHKKTPSSPPPEEEEEAEPDRLLSLHTLDIPLMEDPSEYRIYLQKHFGEDVLLLRWHLSEVDKEKGTVAAEVVIVEKT